MLEIYILTLTTLFATIGPIDVAAIFIVLTNNLEKDQKKVVAYKGVFIATIILLFFAIFGDLLLFYMGISLGALRTAGGVLLFLIGIDMVFARSSGATSTIKNEEKEAKHKDDISVFPLATPLISGPGAISSVILMMSSVKGDLLGQTFVILSILSIMIITLIMLLASNNIHKLLGVTGMQVITRIFGILLCSLAIQFVFDGIKQSELFN